MKFKILTVVMGAVFLVGCGSKVDSQVEEFKMNLSSEKYNEASEIYKSNIDDESFVKYANEFIENDISEKAEHLDSMSYAEIEEDINGISSFYNSEKLIVLKDKIKEIKLDVVLENKHLVEEKKELEIKLKKAEEENATNIDSVTYKNEKFGFSVEYPAEFSRKEEQDYRVTFSTEDGKKSIFCEGWNKAEGENIEGMYASELEGNPNMPYKHKDKESYMVSWNEGENICYKYIVVGEKVVNSFIMKYPKSEEGNYNTILDGVYVSFKPGDLNIIH